MKTLEITIELKPAKLVSTLECENLTDIRRDGNTTRQVNFAIENLFAGHRVKVQDHYMNGRNRIANVYLIKKIFERILLFHYDQDIDIDVNKLEIEIV